MKSFEICLLKHRCRAKCIEFSECRSGYVTISNVNFKDFDDAVNYLSSMPSNLDISAALDKFEQRIKSKNRSSAKMRADAKSLISTIDKRKTLVEMFRPMLVNIAEGVDISATCIAPHKVVRSARQLLDSGF